MAFVITGTVGLCFWVFLWSMDVSGFDAILLAIVLVLAVSALRNLAPYFASRKDR